MNINNLRIPSKGFTKAERVWLVELIKAIKTVHAVQGRNITITETDNGQTVNANDCPTCP